MSQELSGKIATKFDPRMLEALVCPRTQGTLDYDADAQELISKSCLLYTSPSPRDGLLSRMPSSA